MALVGVELKMLVSESDALTTRPPFTSSFRALLFFADSRIYKSFQPVKSPYFCVGKQKKRTSKKDRLSRDM